MEGHEALGNGPPPWPGAPPDSRDTPSNGAPRTARVSADGGAGAPSQDSIVPETQQSQEGEDTATQQRDGEQQAATTSQPSITAEEPSVSGGATEGDAGDSGANEDRVNGEQDQKTSEAAAPPRSTPPEAVSPEEVFDALVDEMKAAPESAQVDAWKVTVSELFAEVFNKAQVNRERVSPNKQRYPKLKGAEFAQLLSFFEQACVIDRCGYANWCRYATAISQDLYNTTWTLTTILESMTSKIRWARAPILNQWAAKVTNGGGSHQQPESQGSRFQHFMFNPAKYTPQDIERLTTLCEQPEAARTGRRLRDGTDDEWVIVQGLAEGNIVSRRLPAFIKSIFDSKERLRLYSTIQAQVEGELRFALVGSSNVPVSRQHTQALKEDILLAAESTQVNLAELHQMLSQTKTISYNRVQKSIHFFFFDRATARKFQFTVVPFKRKTYRLQNMHAPSSGSAWSRQLGADGTRVAPQAEYEIRLYNVTRFLDIGRLSAYFTEHIQAEFELEDMDICTPNSRTSTVWKMKFKLAGCPEFLRGVVRLLWFGTCIILKHPGVGRRLQCLHCGNLGHTMARCSYTDDQLRGPGSVEAHEQEVVQLEDLAKPFASLEEMRMAATKRLELQDQSDKAAAAVMPALKQTDLTDAPSPATTAADADQLQGQESGHERRTIRTVPIPKPQPKRKWVAVPMKGGRTLFAHKAALKQKLSQPHTRFDALAEESDDEDDDEEDEEIKPTAGSATTPEEVIEISSGEDEPKIVKLSAKEKAKLRLIKRNPPVLPSPAQLVALKQRERSALLKGLNHNLERQLPRVKLDATVDITSASFGDIERDLGLKEVATPATGNCMVMALVQALSDRDLAANDQELKEATARLKCGIKYTGQLHMGEQFNHTTRETALANMRRGWMGMSPGESKKQFKWYLEEFASSASDRDTIVEYYNWGCSELLAMAANFLKRNIYVLSYGAAEEGKWNCSMFRPSNMTRASKLIETGEQIILKVEDCVAKIKAEKLDRTGKAPLVLRFWGRHYSAYVHQRKQTTNPTEFERESKSEGDCEMQDAEGLDDGSHHTAESNREASQEPWDPQRWDGNVDSLLERLEGMTVPHALKTEIQHVIMAAHPGRYSELLAFLTNTVASLSLPEQQRILAVDMAVSDGAEVRQLQEQYQIPLCVLQQWKQYLLDSRDEAKERQRDKESYESEEGAAQASSDESYEPSQNESQDDRQIVLAMQTPPRKNRSAQKRAHATTSDERITQGAEVRNKHSAAVLKKGKNGSTKASTRENTTTLMQTQERWQGMWANLASQWPTKAAAPFPTLATSVTLWKKAAKAEPSRLLRLAQGFPYVTELLQALHDDVLIAWTAAWRQNCMYACLVEYRSKATDRVTRQWLDDWKERTSRHSARSMLAPLIDNRDDWEKLKVRKYGDDDLLAECHADNKLNLANHMLCAVIYSKEIRALTGKEDEVENGPTTYVRRHLLALRKLEAYRRAYYGAHQRANWVGIEGFFSTAFEQEETQRTLQY